MITETKAGSQHPKTSVMMNGGSRPSPCSPRVSAFPRFRVSAFPRFRVSAFPRKLAGPPPAPPRFRVSAETSRPSPLLPPRFRGNGPAARLLRSPDLALGLGSHARCCRRRRTSRRYGGIMLSYRQPGTILNVLTFTVPHDHAKPGGETIELFAREVVAADHLASDLPWLLFLQGGPGFGAPRPTGRGSWLDRALKDYRVLLLDQRGTARSSPANRRTLALHATA